MSLMQRFKDLVGINPCAPRVPYEPPAETAKLEREMEGAVRRHQDATNTLDKAVAGAERGARISSVVTKTLVRRQLVRAPILSSAEQAMKIIEGHLNAPPR